MTKSSHQGDADGLTQNQKNRMSDDPADGARNSFTADPEGQGLEDSPDAQGSDQLAEFGKRGSKQD